MNSTSATLDQLCSGVVPRRCYIICATPRCGTNLLCQALGITGVAGRPEEHFLAWTDANADPPMTPAEHLCKALADGTTPNGVFGTKLMWEHFDVVIGQLRTITGDYATPAPRLLATIFPELRYIHGVRRDKVRQAVSLAKAVQSGRWTEFEGWFLDASPDEILEQARRLGLDVSAVSLWTKRMPQYPSSGPTEMRYDFEQIAGFHRTIVEHEQGWAQYFAAAGVVPCAVTYENLATDYVATAFAVMDYLQLPRTDPRIFAFRAVRRQSDAINDEWVARFAEDLAASTS